MFVFTLLVIGLLCLAFKPTRLTGVAGLTLLSLVYPLLFVALLVLGGVFYLIRHYTRRKVYELPRLDSPRSDPRRD
jgi:hypothetical protein